jgi:hypothetical protein
MCYAFFMSLGWRIEAFGCELRSVHPFGPSMTILRFAFAPGVQSLLDLGTVKSQVYVFAECRIFVRKCVFWEGAVDAPPLFIEGVHK